MAGTENTIFSDAIIKLKHATKSVADASDKVLEKDEVLLVSPNSGSGTGAYEMRVGDGSTPVKNLPVAINGMKADNINVEEIETIEEENPTLEGGNAIKNLFGRISKKFSWIETMLGKKVNTADIYDGLDSSNAGKVASANAVRQINEKTDKNTTDISTLTSNLEWKYVADVIGSSTINIPSDACEIFVTVTKSSVIYDGVTTLSLLVPVRILSTVYQDFLNGGYGNNDQQTYLAFFRINKYNAHLYALKVAGQDYTATSQLKMWYR